MEALSRLFAACVGAGVAAGLFASMLLRGQQAAVGIAAIVAQAAIGWWLAPRLVGPVHALNRAACAATIGLGLSTLLPNALGALGLLRTEVYLPLLSVLFVAVWLERKVVASDTPPVRRTAGRAARIEALALASAVALYGIFIWRTLALSSLLPLGWFGGDDLSYHSAAVAVFNDWHDLRTLKYSLGDRATAFYPIGGELQAWTMLAPFRTSDFFMRWSQLPFFGGTLIAIASLALRLGASAGSAGVAALLYATIPRFFPDLALSTGNDCSTAFYAVAAVDGALAMRGSPRCAAYPGLAIGLLAGTKFVGFLYAAPLILLTLLLLRREAPGAGLEPRNGMRSRALVAALTLVGVAAVAGGYTYARNAWVTGNPLFPAFIALGGQPLLPGWPETALSRRMQSPEAEIDVVEFLAGRPRALGRLFPYTIVLAAVLAPAAAIVRRRRWADVLTLLLPMLFFLQFLFLMNDHRDIRYVMAAVAVAAAAYAWLIDQLPGRAPVVLRGATLLLLFLAVRRVAGEDAWSRNWMTVLAIALAGMALVLFRRLQPHEWKSGAALVALALIAIPLGWTGTIERYQETKLEALQDHRPEALVAAQFDRMTRGHGVRLAYAGMNRPYLFEGADLENVVNMVPSHGDASARFFDWSGNALMPFGGGSYDVWMANLRALESDYLVVVRSGGDEPERTWARAHPELFRPIIETPAAEVYEVARVERMTPLGSLRTASHAHPAPPNVDH